MSIKANGTEMCRGSSAMIGDFNPILPYLNGRKIVAQHLFYRNQKKNENGSSEELSRSSWNPTMSIKGFG